VDIKNLIVHTHIFKEGGKHERVENMEAKNLLYGRTLTMTHTL